MRTYNAHARVRKMYLAQDDALARVLTGTGYYDGFRGIDRADVGVEAAMTRCYGDFIRLPNGARYFAEDN